MKNNIYPIISKYKTNRQALRDIADREPLMPEDVDNKMIAIYKLGEITKEELEEWQNKTTMNCPYCNREDDKYTIAILGECYACFDPYYYL